MREERRTKIIEQALASGRSLLTPQECVELLSLYGIPLPPSLLAKTSSEATEMAAKLGFPVVLKIASDDIVHKSDVGGVRVGINSKEELEMVYAEIMASVKKNCPGARIEGVLVQPMIKGVQEVIVGIKRDPSFGPVVLLGLGGVWVELLRDVSLRICPVARDDVLEMLKELKGYPLLNGYRGSKPVDLEALIDLTLKVSQLALDLPALSEMDLNPVMLQEQGKGCIAVDYRMIITKPEVD